MAIGWFALLYKITPGSEEEGGRLFRETGLAEPVVRNDDGEIVGQLITNLVFAGNGHACRVVEFEGELRWVGKHMGGQKVIQDFERDVDQYVEVERDMSDLPGRMAFYREAGMRHVLEPSYESSGSGAESTWFSLLYKLKPGHEEAVSELFANS